jgi:hypothetical protein
MAQKNATPTRDQQASIKAAGLNHMYWTVLKELPSSLIIKHRITGEVKYINKVKENLS